MIEPEVRQARKFAREVALSVRHMPNDEAWPEILGVITAHGFTTTEARRMRLMVWMARKAHRRKIKAMRAKGRASAAQG